MGLADYKGPANHPDCLRAVVGDRVVGVIADYDQGTWFVVESGYALVMRSNGAYWCESPTAVKELVAKRKADVGAWIAETERLSSIPLRGA